MQLVKAGIPVQPHLRLTTALCWFQQSGELNSAIREWQTKPAASKTFTTFHVFIQKEFKKHQKRVKQTVKATGQGIANNVRMQDVPTEAEINMMAMAELLHAVTTQSNAQMEKMMEMFTKSLEAMSSNKRPGQETTSTNQKFPHCKLCHKNHNNCWELQKNASKQLDGNYIDTEPLQTRKAKDLTSAYQKIYQRWKATGVICLNWHILDNEAPHEFKQAICENN
ncbi:hypothetical protein ACHAW6_014425 [Cyclotella cf. meneghiniana]